MSIITLTTDLGTNDSYLASVKGSIYSELKNIKIVDISNNINHYDNYIIKKDYDIISFNVNLFGINENIIMDYIN